MNVDTPTTSTDILSDADSEAARAIGRAARESNPPSPATLARIAAICSDATTAASPPPRGAAIGTPGSGAASVRSGPGRASQQSVGDDAPTAA